MDAADLRHGCRYLRAVAAAGCYELVGGVARLVHPKAECPLTHLAAAGAWDEAAAAVAAGVPEYACALVFPTLGDLRAAAAYILDPDALLPPAAAAALAWLPLVAPPLAPRPAGALGTGLFATAALPANAVDDGLLVARGG